MKNISLCTDFRNDVRNIRLPTALQRIHSTDVCQLYIRNFLAAFTASLKPVVGRITKEYLYSFLRSL